MEDRYFGVNRKMERIALKIVGALLAFMFTLFVSGLLSVTN